MATEIKVARTGVVLRKRVARTPNELEKAHIKDKESMVYELLSKRFKLGNGNE